MQPITIIPIQIIDQKDLQIGIETIGHGCFSSVHKGKLKILEERIEVAVKQLYPSKTLKYDLIHEASVMRQCAHPNILNVYGVCFKSNVIVMGLLKSSLFDLLDNQKEELPWNHRKQISLDIVKGLGYLHDQKIVHCDLKSGNILVTGSNFAKICDFGSSIVDGIKMHERKGTIPWMAPELVRDLYNPTFKSDIYSYGMVLWEISSRKKTKCKEEAPPDCPKAFTTIIDQCRLDDPKDRPDTPKVLKMMEAVQNKLSINETLVSQKNENIDLQYPTILENTATFGDFGIWYNKYKGQPWCDQYHDACIKKMKCQTWDRRYETFELRAQVLSRQEVSHQNATHGATYKGFALYVPSIEIHNEVALTIYTSFYQTKNTLQ